ncbi:hypothetical protein BOX15_Mlig008797g1 [Macrostomum lignano]|uniref:Uncharacterized protein n=2 Tax=Macrostomum lignano TaxID=282301 RepID=A0A267GE43_9PLAT|nr:hypothetical protein BOX15_Mlig008797g1 [Macrostomum lignano]
MSTTIADPATESEDSSSVVIVWKSELYQLQQAAPNPLPVLAVHQPPNPPAQYGPEYHGPIDRAETEQLLAKAGQGAFLIRDSSRNPGQYTLSIRFDEENKHFHLYYDSDVGEHWVGEKRFNNVSDLVADGLIHFYVETRGAHILKALAQDAATVYEESPYYTARYYTLQSRGWRRRLAPNSAAGASASAANSGANLIRRDSRLLYLQQQEQRHRRASEDGAASSVSSLSPSIAAPVAVVVSSLSPAIPSTNSTLASASSGRVDDRDSSSADGGSSLSLSSASCCDTGKYEKAHCFRLTTFKGPHWCDFCQHFMWGLIAQGFRCTDCGFQAHRRCADRVPPHCLPDMKYVKRVFGSDLTTLVKATPPTAVPGVPAVLERCVDEIESRGLDSEGLYRVAGFHDDIEVIKLAFDKETLDNPVDLSRFDDVNTVASVLKAYLRSLPIPVITYDMYDKFLAVVRREGDDSTAQLNASLRQCVSELPPAHRQTLNYLCRHLHRVAARQRINMMSPENLAIVLAPTLLRSPSAEYIADPLRVLNNAKYERLVVEMLISEYETVFA